MDISGQYSIGDLGLQRSGDWQVSLNVTITRSNGEITIRIPDRFLARGICELATAQDNIQREDTTSDATANTPSEEQEARYWANRKKIRCIMPYLLIRDNVNAGNEFLSESVGTALRKDPTLEDKATSFYIENKDLVDNMFQQMQRIRQNWTPRRMVFSAFLAAAVAGVDPDRIMKFYEDAWAGRGPELSPSSHFESCLCKNARHHSGEDMCLITEACLQDYLRGVRFIDGYDIRNLKHIYFRKET